MKLRKNVHPDPHVRFDALLGWNATADVTGAPQPSKIAAILKGVAASTALALLGAGLVLPAVGATAITVREARNYWVDLPTALPRQELPQRSTIYAANGTKIATFYAENRVLVSLHQVPPALRDALIAMEDTRYYSHNGFDVRGTVRALVSNLTSTTTQGGSTITQQYVKQVLLDAATTDKERADVVSQTSYLRKLREARLATALGNHLTKDQILEGYLNIAYFGDGAYGIGAAAKHFFGKPVSQVTLAEGALLVGLVKNPTGYDPTNNRKVARDRRNDVLFRMHQLGYIGDRAYRKATASRVILHLTSPANGCHTSKYPFFCQWVKNQLENDPVFGETKEARQQRLFRGGMSIRTTLDPKAQRIAQHAVDASLGRDNRVAAAAVTVQPGTGNVIAMATNRTYGQGGNKTEVLLPALPAYQPGSNMKPFTLTAAIERGYDITAVWNAPSVYAPADLNYPGTGYVNSGSAEAGPLNASQALWRSSNTWFVHLESQVGVLNVADMAGRLGITSLPRTGDRAITPRDGSLTLGTYEVSPLELAGAYATFAAHGTHCTPVGIATITGPDGKPVTVPDADCHQAIAPGVADTVAAIMQGVIDGPDVYRTGKDMTLGRPAAGKTGTTQENAAVWFSGYTPQYATSIWVGDPRGGFAHPLQNFYANGQFISRAYGGLVAGPIWKEIMLGIHQGLPKREFAPADPNAMNGYTNVTPDVRGLTLAQAYQVLTAAGVTVTIAKRTDAPDPLWGKNRVSSTVPAPGSVINYHGKITLTLTAGSSTNVKPP